MPLSDPSLRARPRPAILRRRGLRRGAVSPVLSLVLTLALALAGPALARPGPPPERASGVLAVALAQGAAGDWDGAAATAGRAGARAPLVAALLDWHRLRAGDGDWRAVAAFAAAHPDWPLLDRLRARAEGTLARSAPPAAVTAFFDGHDPATGAGAVALVAALGATGATAAAEAAAIRAWRGLTLSSDQEGALRAAHGPALAAHDAERLDMLLWRRDRAGALRQAARMGDGARALTAARLGLAARAQGVDGLIAAVPAALSGDPGLAFERFDWRMDRQLHDSAAELILERSAAGTLGRPEAWARGRAFLARQALAAGEARLAYRLAAGHGLEAGGAFADMEWFAGFVALRFLDEADIALRHFQRLRVGVSTPISLARAGYWEGRAHAALNAPANAAAAFAFAAEHQTTFYGQLAAERIGLPMDPALAGAELPATAAVAGLPMLRAAALLRGAGAWYTGRQFFLHLGAGLEPAALEALAARAIALHEPNWAVMLGRLNAGAIPVAAAFPLTDLAAMDLPAPPELILAIARRESEFDAGIVSPADARGLMQVLPGTGRLMADRLGLAFEDRMLLDDPEMNVRLGAAYLAQLRDSFGPSLALVAAGYNAGPGRPRQWIARLGDPRGLDDDALIDWIEQVPFAETRSYIMRVAESLVVYRARLAGGPVPFDLVATLRGR